MSSSLSSSRSSSRSSSLAVRFLGVRGSVATPGTAFSSVGGNTACVEVSAGETHIVLDAGTGLRTLGEERMRTGLRHHTLLLSHMHWDHLQGLPFFPPVYVPGHRVEIATGPNGIMPLAQALPSLFSAPFFPVEFAAVSEQISLRELRSNDRFTIGEITVTMARLNHPDPVYGFRLEANGHSIVYATDTEHYACVDPTLKKLAADADILIYDCQYLPAEYPSRVGWGHSTWQAGAELARAAGVSQLVMFHHDPGRTDEQVAEIEAQARQALPGTVAAREGLVLVAEEAERAAAA
jgi:phosphoribosyl 1,2-cyclic phosphodiesterase